MTTEDITTTDGEQKQSLETKNLWQQILELWQSFLRLFKSKKTYVETIKERKKNTEREV